MPSHGKSRSKTCAIQPRTDFLINKFYLLYLKVKLVQAYFCFVYLNPANANTIEQEEALYQYVFNHLDYDYNNKYIEKKNDGEYQVYVSGDFNSSVIFSLIWLTTKNNKYVDISILQNLAFEPSRRLP